MFESGRCPLDLASRHSDFASRNRTIIISNGEMNDIVKIVSHMKNLAY